MVIVQLNSKFSWVESDKKKGWESDCYYLSISDVFVLVFLALLRWLFLLFFCVLVPFSFF